MEKKSTPVLKHKLDPDQRNFPEGFQGMQKILVHFTATEAKGFDLIQGGPVFDEKIPIRTYEPFGKMLLNPEFRDYYLSVVAQDMEKGQMIIPSDVEAFHRGEHVLKKTKFVPAPGDKIPQIQELAAQGHGRQLGHDKIMVYMPSNMVYLLGLERGGVPINPSTGFPAFGWGWFEKLGKEIQRPFKSNTVREGNRITATVGGAILGGPLGAAAGSAVGSALTGRKPQDWLPQAGKAALATYGFQNLAPYIPGLGQLGSAMGSSGIPGMSQLGNFMGSSAAPSGGASSLPAWGRMTSTSEPSAMQFLGSQGQQPSGGGNFLSQLMPNASSSMNPFNQQEGGGGGMGGPLSLLSMGTQLYGHHQNKKALEEQARLQRESYEKSMRDARDYENEMLEKTGFFKHVEEDPYIQVPNPNFGRVPGEQPYLLKKRDEFRFDDGRPWARNSYSPPQRLAQGGTVASPQYRQTGPYEYVAEMEKKPLHTHGPLKLKKSILIDGHGKGQDDTVHTQVPEGSYIIRADVMSMLGDGSTSAGAEVFQDFLDSVLADTDSKAYSYFLEEEHHKPRLKVGLSRDEGYVRPSYVMALGGGDHTKGVRLLNKFVQQLIHHKKSNGTKLPPKAKPIEHYMHA
mgnify:CR=1 FL=1